MSRKLRKINPLEKAIIIVGSQSMLAKLIGFKQPTISYWLHECGGKPPSVDACKKIEKATDGIVKAHHLNPEIFD